MKLWDVDQNKLRSHLHNEAVEAIAFTPDGKFVAATYDGVHGILVWDTVSIRGKPKLRYAVDKTATVRSVAFSSDGKTLVSGESDGTVKVWDAAVGKVQATLQGPPVLWSVLISRDGKTLIAGGYDKDSAGLIKVWDLETQKEQFAIRTTKSIYSAALSPDEKVLVSGGGNGALKLWNAATGKELATVEAHTSVIRSVAFSPDSKSLATASLDRTVKVWDVPESK